MALEACLPLAVYIQLLMIKIKLMLAMGGCWAVVDTLWLERIRKAAD
jgi:hypothetical protein